MGPTELAALGNGAGSTKRDESATIDVVLIDRRALVRDCLAKALKSSQCNVTSYPTLECFLEERRRDEQPIVVLYASGRSKDAEVQRAVFLLSQAAGDLPAIVMSDEEDPDQIVAILEKGARGYIPTSVPLHLAIEAMRLVKAGGAYVPASSLVAARRTPAEQASANSAVVGMFTARQAAVIEALRRGKANKIIAYELNMRESTVKVHVRNIMRKLKAKNRTEVAFMANDLLQDASR